MKRIALTVMLWMIVCGLSAQLRQGAYDIEPEKKESEEAKIRRGDKLKAYRVVPDVGDVERVAPDTATLKFYHRSNADARSLSMGYLANLHSPWLSATYFDRPAETPQFMYRTGFAGLMFEPSKVLFYDTKTPFAETFYQRNGSLEMREEQLHITFATNMGRPINLGADFDYTYSNGFYNSNRTKNVSYRVFGSYRTDRYEAFGYIANDYFNITENGGVTDDSFITSPQDHGSSRGGINSKDVPVRFPGNILFNRLRSGQAFLSHRYNLGAQRKEKIEDHALSRARVQKDTTYFVPVGSIVHYLTYRTDSRRFVGKPSSLWTKEYKRYYIKEIEKGVVSVLPNDTSRMWQINNTVALALREGFKPWMKFGLTGYVRLENRRYYEMDSIAGSVPKTSEFSTFVGGEMSRTEGKGLNFRLRAEFAPIGSDIGALRLKGYIRSSFRLWGERLGLEAWGELTNLRPAFFVRRHHGTFHWWDKDFSYIRRLELAGRANSELTGLSLQARTATLQNHIYFDAGSLPVQVANPIQIVEVRSEAKKKIGIFAYDIEAAYQLSSDQKAMPLPTLSAYATVYLDFYAFKVLKLQLGLEARYHTAYYAPYYEPATQQFAHQQSIKIGGRDPLLTAYVNAHLKRTRFFITMYNVGESIFRPYRFTLPHYPRNPMIVRLGLSVDFNN